MSRQRRKSDHQREAAGLFRGANRFFSASQRLGLMPRMSFCSARRALRVACALKMPSIDIKEYWDRPASFPA